MNEVDYWNVSPEEAVTVQQRLRDRVCLNDDLGTIRTVAGIDVSIGRFSKQGKCGIVVLSFPQLEVIEMRTCSGDVRFPYVPGLLAFREVPIFLRTYELLEHKPDLMFFDGQGYAHPRRFGLACHAGVLLDAPSIGCAKSRLIGEYAEPAIEAGSSSPRGADSGERIGSSSPLSADSGERIGDAVRTKTGVKCIFVSPGHRVSFDTATRLTLECTRAHRIPEPTRLAHNFVSG